MVSFLHDSNDGGLVSVHEVLVSSLDVFVLCPEQLGVLIDLGIRLLLPRSWEIRKLVIEEVAQLDLAVVQRLKVGTHEVQEVEHVVLLSYTLLRGGQRPVQGSLGNFQIISKENEDGLCQVSAVFEFEKSKDIPR